MPLFSSRPREVTISQSEFVSSLQATPACYDYTLRFKSGAASAMALAIFDAEAKRHGEDGFWSGDKSLTPEDLKAPAAGRIKIRQEHRSRFDLNVAGHLLLDVIEFTNKKKHITSLITDAVNRALYDKSKSKFEPEGRYYKTWNDLTVQGKTAAWPPPQPGNNNNLDKIKAWLDFTQTGPAGLALVNAHTKNGTWPLSDDVSGVWKPFSGDAPPYRLPVMGRYPSSIAGRILLRECLSDIASKASGLKSGNGAWQDWALCALGAVIAAQGFPDANKRTARVTYAIAMASAGIPFRAPSPGLANALGQMTG